MMTEHEVRVLLGTLKTLDTGGWVDIGQTAVMVWTGVLNREPAIPFQAAMHTAADVVAREGQKFPTPGDFRGMVAEVVCRIPTVATARKQIERSMKLNYPGMPPKYTPDQIVLDAVREIGGVHVFRVSQSERETAALWRRFTAKYQEMRAERMEVADIAAEWQALAGSQDGTPALAGSNGEVRR